MFIRSIQDGSEGHCSVPVRRVAKSQTEKVVRGYDSPISYAVYEPSHITNVLDSEYWQWRRYRSYYRYVYGEEGMEKRYREVREFMKG
jgi:hypothetical protein